MRRQTLALNPAVDRAGLDRLLGAVAAQVAPRGEHSYIYGESERLARGFAGEKRVSIEGRSGLVWAEGALNFYRHPRRETKGG